MKFKFFGILLLSIFAFLLFFFVSLLGENHHIDDSINNYFTKLKAEDFSFVDDDTKSSIGNPLTRINSEILTYAKIKQQEIDELRKSENFRREFIADISHELKTPIFAAQGFVHTLLDGAVKDKNVETDS